MHRDVRPPVRLAIIAAAVLAVGGLAAFFPASGDENSDTTPSLAVVPFRLPPFGYCEGFRRSLPAQLPSSAADRTSSPGERTDDGPRAASAIPDRFSLAHHRRPGDASVVQYDADGGSLTIDERTLVGELRIPAPPGAWTQARIHGEVALLVRGGLISFSVPAAGGARVVASCGWQERAVTRLYHLSGDTLVTVSAVPAGAASQRELLDVAASLTGPPAVP